MRLSRKFIVDIDALFDTRIGWVRANHPEAMLKIDPNVYASRYTDAWADVAGINDFNKSWRKRDINALRMSVPTIMQTAIKNEFEAIRLEQAMMSPVNTPSLTINLWPYKELNSDEVSLFLECFRDIYPNIMIDLLWLSPEELTPGRLASVWDGYITYDYYLWLEKNAANLKNRIPEFTITRPSLFSDELTNEAIGYIERDNVNPFKAHVEFMAEYVGIDILDSKVFSLDPTLHQDLFVSRTQTA